MMRLGWVAGMVLMVSLACASGAAAAEYQSELPKASNTYVTAQGEGAQKLPSGLSGAPGVGLDCSGLSAQGTFANPATAVSLSSIVYSGCVVHSLIPYQALVNTNGCSFRLGQPTGTESPYAMKSLTIECPKEKEIVTTVPSGGCILKIPPQTVTGTSSVVNSVGPPKTFTVALHFAEVTVYSSGTASVCGSAGTYKIGVLDGKMTLQGFKDESHKTATGIFVA